LFPVRGTASNDALSNGALHLTVAGCPLSVTLELPPRFTRQWRFSFPVGTFLSCRNSRPVVGLTEVGALRAVNDNCASRRAQFFAIFVPADLSWVADGFCPVAALYAAPVVTSVLVSFSIVFRHVDSLLKGGHEAQPWLFQLLLV
jgi:hypothetical protein